MEGTLNEKKRVRKLDAEGNVMEEYFSAKEAARQNKISYRHLTRCMQEGRECHGERYEYIAARALIPLECRQAGYHARHNPYLLYKEKQMKEK